jgi:hypothetical protein
MPEGSMCPASLLPFARRACKLLVPPPPAPRFELPPEELRCRDSDSDSGLE